MRYKYAWSTVVRDHGFEWLPDGSHAKLEFVACSGAHIENMMDQMDKTTRPKITIMEVGGNNADFYPMADACIFHAQAKSYGPHFEEDNPLNPKGECWREINLVGKRVRSDDIKNKIIDNIHRWRGHLRNMGNSASLYLHGYPWFFAFGEECEDWTFGIPLRKDNTKLVLGMCKAFNELVSIIF